MIAAKLGGEAGYVDDLAPNDALHVKLVLSPHASARILSIHAEAAKSVEGVVDVFTGRDIRLPRASPHDEALAPERVLWSGQPVAAVVAETYPIACDAAELVDVDYELLPPILSPEAAMEPGSPVLASAPVGPGDAQAHGSAEMGPSLESLPRNCTNAVRYSRGDVAAALRASAHVVRRRYDAAATHHAPLEPHAVRARAHGNGRYTVWTACQGAFDIRDAIARLLELPPTAIEVVPLAVGGGFGGKLLPVLEPLACLLARRTGRPVHICLTRTEEFLFARGCPGATFDIAVGCDSDGRLTGLEFRARYDTGAGPGGLGSAGSAVVVAAYRVPNLLLECLDVSTNKSPVTAYRAPGGPQGFFALESAIDELASMAGLDPLELRLRNATDAGDPDLDGSAFPRVGLVACLQAAKRHPIWRAPLGPGEGVGAAVGLVRGARQACSATLRSNADGTLTLLHGSVDIAGTDETLALIAAAIAGVDPNRVRVHSMSTDVAPVGGAASGSKTTYTLGSAVVAAARELRRQLLEIAGAELEADPADLEISDGRVVVRGTPARGLAVETLFALTDGVDARYPPLIAHGRSGPLPRAPMFAVHLAHVRVDTELGAVHLLHYAAIQDVGHAINAAAIAGQIHGGVAQGIGRALGEAIVYSESGHLRTASFGDYLVPTADSMPSIEVALIECPSEQGPLGARGAAEVPAVPGPAAIANAVTNATGTRITQIPIPAHVLVQP